MVEHPARGRRESERAAQAVSAVPQLCAGPRRRHDALDIGTTPLLRAARGADIAAIELLIGAARCVDLPQRDGITPLMVAVGAGASSIDTRGKFRTELDALATAAALLDGGRCRRRTRRARPHGAAYAAAVGYTDVAKQLVEHGADLAATDADGVTPLDAANGKLRGRGRGAGATYPATVAALEELLAVAN